MAAINALAAHGVSVVKTSRIWLTAPVPISDQPWYHNAVAQVETEMDARVLLHALHEIEREFGRERVVRNEARIIDLDLLCYNDIILDEDNIRIPHPRLHERAFVLLPLSEIEKNWVHPVSGRTLADLVAALPADQKAEPLEAEGGGAHAGIR